MYPQQSTEHIPEGARESGERTAAEVLYGKEVPKEQPTDSQQKSEGNKDWLEKGAEDAAKADRYDLKLPDGVAIVDEPLMSDFTKLGRENNLTAEQMQRFADLHLRAIGDSARQLAEFHEIGENRYTEVKGWETEFQNDPEAGGANAKQTISQALKVLDLLGTPEEVQRLKRELERTGLGNHPILIKGRAQLARRL